MSEIGVRKVVARMISEPSFANAVHNDPKGALAASGYALEPQEIAAIGKIKPGDLSLKLKHAGPGGVAFGIETFTSVKTT